MRVKGRCGGRNKEEDDSEPEGEACVCVSLKLSKGSSNSVVEAVCRCWSLTACPKNLTGRADVDVALAEVRTACPKNLTGHADVDVALAEVGADSPTCVSGLDLEKALRSMKKL